MTRDACPALIGPGCTYAPPAAASDERRRRLAEAIVDAYGGMSYSGLAESECTESGFQEVLRESMYFDDASQPATLGSVEGIVA